MPDVLDSAMSFHDAALQGNRSRTVRYFRGADWVDVDAVMGRTPIGFDLGNGILQSWQALDWLIDVSALVLGGHEITPEVGDRLETTVNGSILRCTVQNMDNGRCCDFTNEQTRRTWRVHSKESA